MNLELPYPVNPRLAGSPNLEMNGGVGNSIIGHGQCQGAISKWAKEFEPINTASMLETAKNRLFFAQLVIADPESIAVFIESDHVGFLPKPLREKAMKNVQWLNAHRYPAISQAFITGDLFSKLMVRLRTNGQLAPSIKQDSVLNSEIHHNYDDLVINQPYKLSSGVIYGTATASTTNVFWGVA